jgi:multidrug efflux pump subunit AcrB
MNSILSLLFQQKKLALVFTIFMIALGLNSVSSIQRDKFPNVDLDIMSITTIYPNASPEDVELNVTNKIEKELKSVNGIDNYFSTSKENASLITVKIDGDIENKEEVKRDVRNAVNNVADLPSEVKDLPVVKDIKSSTIESVLQVNLVDNKTSYNDLRKIVDNLQREIEQIEGVAKVETAGYLDREIKIHLSEEKLAQHKISLNSVIKSISDHNVRYSAGLNNSFEQEKNIVVLAKYAKAEDVQNIVVKASFDGPRILVKDIATVIDSNKKETSIIRVNGHKSFILQIKKQEQADVITTVDNIKEHIKSFKEKQPETLNIFYSDDLSTHVKNRLEIVLNNGLVGLILVVLVIGLFLSFKTAFWVSLSLPVTLLGSVLLLAVFGETINLISLAAMILVLGLVVDDSIIIAESIHHFVERDGRNIQAVVKGFKKVIMPVITTILTTIMAFSSMFMMSGTMGKFIYIMPLVVIFALVISFLEIIFALPAHLSTTKGKEITWFNRYEVKFEAFLNRILKFRYYIVLGFIGLFVGSIILVTTYMKFTLFPTIAADKITATIELPLGTSLKKSEKIIKKVDDLIIKTLGNNLDSLSSNIAATYAHITYSEISLTPTNDRILSASELAKTLRKVTKDIKGVTKINFKIKRAGPPTGGDIEINLIGGLDENRLGATEKLMAILENIKGISNVDRDDKPGRKRISVQLDIAKIQELNIDYSGISRYLIAAFNGIEITKMRGINDDIYFRIYLGDGSQNETAIENIKIANRNNQLIPMSQFASIRHIKGEPDYNHYKGERSIKVSASIDDDKNSSTSAMNEALEKLNITKNFPDVQLINEGGSKESADSMASFKTAFKLAIIGMYLLLMILFNSYSQPLMVLIAIPFGIIGVIWAFFFHNEPLSFFSVLGFLALVGVVVNDSLVLVNHINHKLKEQGNKFKNKIALVANGSKERLRAVVLTTLTTLGGILPLAYGWGGSDFLLQPMAMSLGYGLIFASVMTLILLPCFYLINIDIINFKHTMVEIFKRTEIAILIKNKINQISLKLPFKNKVND